MHLTPELVARVQRVVEDAGPRPDIVYLTESDRDAVVEELLASRPQSDDMWLFAYGSLIWKPEVEHLGERLGTARGWHRAFCIKLTRWRGTIEKPGLMLGLDRGGECKGVLYRLDGRAARANIGKLVRREMSFKPPTNMPRWINVVTEEGAVGALAFTTNRSGAAYAGKVTLEEAADLLAEACGHLGSCAEYLYNTVSHLEARGIRDRNLWTLQRLVAERIAAPTPTLTAAASS